MIFRKRLLILIGNVLVFEERSMGEKSARFQWGKRDILATMQVSTSHPSSTRTCGLFSFALIVGTLYLLREVFIPLALAILLSFLWPLWLRVLNAGA